ncbi:hypothetical protein GGTG_06391 [Gaeumannomyces tritici R3-111a-1]|uniref:Uncharacterized protein n=1 Tax=Gaeumannomyces tritici (strain R3-111a-1) TaxID=644352 RepID=J3NYN9_GAET3|nr:hypothetical protein GGTG_06391 [Gaeumannomyces tritici R3-111a-1]EJT76472.1 hypothetical protein GGTG_06391 [Gaeumannomyces tritici R3-111a-1]
MAGKSPKVQWALRQRALRGRPGLVASDAGKGGRQTRKRHTGLPGLPRPPLPFQLGADKKRRPIRGRGPTGDGKGQLHPPPTRDFDPVAAVVLSTVPRPATIHPSIVHLTTVRRQHKSASLEGPWCPTKVRFKASLDPAAKPPESVVVVVGMMMLPLLDARDMCMPLDAMPLWPSPAIFVCGRRYSAPVTFVSASRPASDAGDKTSPSLSPFYPSWWTSRMPILRKGCRTATRNRDLSANGSSEPPVRHSPTASQPPNQPHTSASSTPHNHHLLGCLAGASL